MPKGYVTYTACTEFSKCLIYEKIQIILSININIQVHRIIYIYITIKYIIYTYFRFNYILKTQLQNVFLKAA